MNQQPSRCFRKGQTNTHHEIRAMDFEAYIKTEFDVVDKINWQKFFALLGEKMENKKKVSVAVSSFEKAMRKKQREERIKKFAELDKLAKTKLFEKVIQLEDEVNKLKNALTLEKHYSCGYSKTVDSKNEEISRQDKRIHELGDDLYLLEKFSLGLVEFVRKIKSASSVAVKESLKAAIEGGCGNAKFHASKIVEIINEAEYPEFPELKHGVLSMDDLHMKGDY